jgi:multiple sugar transport system substrate-binding protein
VPGLASGKTLADLAEEWQTEMQNEAQVVGYTIG